MAANKKFMKTDSDYEVTRSVTYNVQKTWMRLSVLSWTYAEMSEAAFSEFLDLRKDPLLDNRDEELIYERMQVEKRLISASIQAIVFAAMACEAAIYDLAAIHLGDKRADLIDKMDALGKWTIVPHLICGHDLCTDGPAIQALRTLITTRNSLVHYKSLPGEMTTESLEKSDKKMRTIIDSTRECFQAMVLLSLELNRVLGMKAGVLPFYEKNIPGTDSDRSPELKKFMNNVRNVDRNAAARRNRA